MNMKRIIPIIVFYLLIMNVSFVFAATYPATCPAEAKAIVEIVGGCSAVDRNFYSAIWNKCCVSSTPTVTPAPVTVPSVIPDKTSPVISPSVIPAPVKPPTPSFTPPKRSKSIKYPDSYLAPLIEFKPASSVQDLPIPESKTNAEIIKEVIREGYQRILGRLLQFLRFW